MRARDAPVRQRSLWEHNLALVLRQVPTTAPPARAISRAEIAAATGLTRATVSSLVDDLLAGCLITEVDPAPRTGAGRPAAGLVLAPHGPAGLGLEINVDYLAACVVDLTGAVRHRARVPVDQRERPVREVLRAVAGLAGSAVAAVGELSVAGAALAVPGVVDDGILLLAPNLGWRDVPVAGPLRAAPGWPDLPVTVDNEANLAALGELSAAPDLDGASFLYLSGEVGIGAGIVLSGALFRGSHGAGGEIGHVPVNPDGPPCHCGARGCLEQYAGQEAIMRAARAPGARPVGSGSSREALDRIMGLAADNDPAMLAALAEAATALGVAVSGVLNVLDLETVVLGGNFARLAPWVAGPVERELGDRVLAAGWAPPRVRASVLGTEATVVGAARSVVQAIRAQPARYLDRAAGAPVTPMVTS
jgi:predicted NBD/HSP70 family sugar kinase